MNSLHKSELLRWNDSKEKRSGEVKGRGSADGRPQRDHMPKDENSAPSVSIEALMLSCMIDAMKKRVVQWWTYVEHH